jgi:hypothetical protein
MSHKFHLELKLLLGRLSEGADKPNKKEDATQKFAIGERIRIINPGLSQATTGTIAKIGTSRITVQTRKGDKIIRAAKNLNECKRNPRNNPTLHEYLKEFQSLVQVLEHYGTALGAEGPYQDSVNAQVMADTVLTPAEYRARSMAVAKQKSVAIGFLKRADRKRYGGLWGELKNNYTRGQAHCPNDLMGAYNLLLHYKPPPPQQQTQREKHTHDNGEVSGLTFLQNAPPVPGTDGVAHDPKVLQLQHSRTLRQRVSTGRHQARRSIDASGRT